MNELCFTAVVVLNLNKILTIDFNKQTLHKNGVFHWGFLQSMWPNPQFPVDLVTQEILNGKLHFLCIEK